MIRIYVARHGETTWNVERRIQGTSDPDLTAKGNEQSVALLEQLRQRPLSAIYTSTRQRAIHTAQPISDCLRIPIRTQSELDEMNFGIWEGRTPEDFGEDFRKEWQRYREQRLTFRIPGGETYLDVLARVTPFAEKITAMHEGEEILVVGHRGSNRMLIAALLDYPLEEAVKIDQANDCIYLVERNGGAKVSRFIHGRAIDGLLFESDHFHHVSPTDHR
jgi:broad specificity phosphatase PhoE